MVRKILSVGFGVVGLMLTLAGFNLIALSQSFLLYLGVFIIVLAVLTFLR